jgi:hypothetical protein
VGHLDRVDGERALADEGLGAGLALLGVADEWQLEALLGLEVLEDLADPSKSPLAVSPLWGGQAIPVGWTYLGASPDS